MGIKVLLLSHKFYPDIGGIETISEFLAHSFSKKGYRVHVLTWSTDQAEKPFPFKIIRRPKLHEIFREHRWADIIFENNPCLRLSWPNIFFKRPSFIGVHTWISRADSKVAWQDRLKIRWLSRAYRVIACSDAIRKNCWPDAVVISNPYQDEVFRVLPDVTRNLDFVFLGRLVSDKGADLAIKAFHRLLANGSMLESGSPGLSMSIIGEGPERDRLERLVFSLGLENNITFMGALRGNDLVVGLNRHKYLIVPSVWEEPFGIVALEGMACGCLPIVSDGGGLPDAVGKAGLTFERGSVEKLVICMTKIVDNPYLDQQLRDEAQRHLQAHRPDRIADQYFKMIEGSVLS